MYNTQYKCVKPFNVYNGKQEPIKIKRGTVWSLCWCGGGRSFKELTNGQLTLSLPDMYVSNHFKKI